MREVSDEAILEAKAQIGAGGFGCEPASVAGAKLFREQGVISLSDRVVSILTDHQLKDPTATVAYHSVDPARLSAAAATEDDAYATMLRKSGVTQTPAANRPIIVENKFDSIMALLDCLSFAEAIWTIRHSCASRNWNRHERHHSAEGYNVRAELVRPDLDEK